MDILFVVFKDTFEFSESWFSQIIAVTASAAIACELLVIELIASNLEFALLINSFILLKSFNFLFTENSWLFFETDITEVKNLKLDFKISTKLVKTIQL